MYIIIVGAGDIGYYLAQLLIEEEHDIVIIEKDAAVCEEISKELDIVVINGDATQQRVLEKAGIKESDAVVAMTNVDETNMVISLLAKELGAKNVASRIGRVEYDEAVLKRLGIDIVIHPEAAAAGYIAELITKPNVLDLAFISKGHAEIMEIEVKEKSKLVNKKIGDIDQPKDSSIVAYYDKNNELVIVSPDMIIPVGAKVLVLTKTSASNKVKNLFSE